MECKAFIIKDKKETCLNDFLEPGEYIIASIKENPGEIKTTIGADGVKHLSFIAAGISEITLLIPMNKDIVQLLNSSPSVDDFSANLHEMKIEFLDEKSEPILGKGKLVRSSSSGFLEIRFYKGMQ
jgi:hypothetical protein